MSDIKVSYSRMVLSEKCEAAYYYNYILKLAEYRPHFNAHVGTSVHHAIETFYDDKSTDMHSAYDKKLETLVGIRAQQSLSEAAAFYFRTLDTVKTVTKSDYPKSTKMYQLVYKPAIERLTAQTNAEVLEHLSLDIKPSSDLLKSYIDGKRSIDNFIKTESERTDEYRVVTELSLTGLDIAGIPISGYVDRIEFTPYDNKAKIVDYKTGKQSFSQKDVFGTGQLPFYALAVRDQYDITEIGFWKLPTNTYTHEKWDRDIEAEQLSAITRRVEATIAMDQRLRADGLGDSPNIPQYNWECKICQFNTQCEFNLLDKETIE